MVKFLHGRRDEKNRTNIYRVVCISSIQCGSTEIFGTENYAWRLNLIYKVLWISSHFDKENYTWGLGIVQHFSCLILLGHFVRKYTLKNI